MTPVQKQVLDAIEALTIDGVSPTFDEIREHCGMASKSGVHRVVHALAERGFISLSAGKRRTVRVISKSAEALPFSRLAEGALEHVRQQWAAGRNLTSIGMRQALLRAFQEAGQ